MKAKLKLTALLLAAFMLIGVFAGCNNNKKNNAVTATVSFDLCGGTNADGGASIADATVTVGGKYGALPAPKKSGYSFVGWCLDFSGSGNSKNGKAPVLTADSAVDGSDVIDGVILLFARWELQADLKVNVTFKLQGGMWEYGGSAADKTEEFTVGLIYGNAFPDNPVHTEDTFAGWYYNAAGTGNSLNRNSTVPEGDHNIYAVWKTRKTVWDFNNPDDRIYTDFQQGYMPEYVPHKDGVTWLRVYNDVNLVNSGWLRGFYIPDIPMGYTLSITIDIENSDVDYFSLSLGSSHTVLYNVSEDIGNRPQASWPGGNKAVYKTFKYVNKTGADISGLELFAHFPELDKVNWQYAKNPEKCFFYVKSIRIENLAPKTLWDFNNPDDRIYSGAVGDKGYLAEYVPHNGAEWLRIYAPAGVNYSWLDHIVMPVISAGETFSITVDIEDSDAFRIAVTDYAGVVGMRWLYWGDGEWPNAEESGKVKTLTYTNTTANDIADLRFCVNFKESDSNNSISADREKCFIYIKCIRIEPKTVWDFGNPADQIYSSFANTFLTDYVTYKGETWLKAYAPTGLTSSGWLDGFYLPHIPKGYKVSIVIDIEGSNVQNIKLLDYNTTLAVFYDNNVWPGGDKTVSQTFTYTNNSSDAAVGSRIRLRAYFQEESVNWTLINREQAFIYIKSITIEKVA